MFRANKFFGSDKQVLKDIWLSFFPGAKIGVLGPNGAGKSTLLRIMAGVDKDFERRGRARTPGIAIGYLPQEPQLDADQGRARQRRGRRRRTSATCSTASTRSATKFAEPMCDDEMDKLLDEQGELQDADRRGSTAGSSTASSRSRWTRCACPPGDADVDQALRRRAAPRRALPAAAVAARHAAARRADQPPRRRVGRVARAAPARVSRAPSSRSPTIATSSTTSPAGSSSSTAATASRGRATTRRWLEQKEAAPRRRGEAGERPRSARCSASSSGCACRPRRGRPRARRACTRVRGAARRGAEQRNETRRDPHPARPAPRRRWSSRPSTSAQGRSATGC